MDMGNRIEGAVVAVCSRLRRSGLDGGADMLAWAVTQGHEPLFLAAERCADMATDTDMLPATAPATLGKACRAAAACGMAVAVGLTDGIKAPSGFGIAFSLRARNARDLVAGLRDDGIVLCFDETWGTSCGMPALGAGRGNAAFLDAHAGVSLRPSPHSDREEHAFASAVERCMLSGIPWARTIDLLSVPKVSSEWACRMLFHAVGHACRKDEAQAHRFLSGAMREAAV